MIPKNVRSVTLSFILDFNIVIADEIEQLYFFIVVSIVSKLTIMETVMLSYICLLQCTLRWMSGV